jgi:uncharacterized membrane protein YphA (DoxX/SURF4 family)
MEKILKSEILKICSRMVLSLIFIFFAIDKIADPVHFAKEINNYKILPDYLINISAIILPWIELFVGFLIFIGAKVKSASIISAGLLIVFIIAVLTAMAKGLNINCGCSGSVAQKVGWVKVFENISLTILCIYLSVFPESKFSIQKFAEK